MQRGELMVVKNTVLNNPKIFILFSGIIIIIFLVNKLGIAQDCNQVDKVVSIGQNIEISLRGCAMRRNVERDLKICTVTLFANTQLTPHELFTGNYPWKIELKYVYEHFLSELMYKRKWRSRFVELDVDRNSIEEFLKTIPNSVSIGDMLEFTWLPNNGLTIQHKGKELYSIKDKNMAKTLSIAVCKSFLCDIPPDGYKKNEGEWTKFVNKLLGEEG